MRIFGENDLASFLKGKRTNLSEEVLAQSEDYILGVGRDAFVSYLVEKYHVEPLTLRFQDVYAVPGETRVGASGDPRQSRLTLAYHIPCEGGTQLLGLRPSTHAPMFPDVSLDQASHSVAFTLQQKSNDPSVIEKRATELLKVMQDNYRYLSVEVKGFNEGLRKFAEDELEGRKAELLARRQFVAALEIPIRRPDAAPTQVVPIRSPKRVEVERPTVAGPYRAEPTISESVYVDILTFIHDLGKVLETHPSLYARKQEEDLRDLLLLVLQPNFVGAATGETFNKAGKTDILLRHENTNLFVAECKFWAGEKAHGEALSQLLSYLTWRDSKTALVVFVKNKDFTRVLETSKQATQSHECHLRLVSEVQPGWLDHRFYLPGDPNREIRVAVQLFHLP